MQFQQRQNEVRVNYLLSSNGIDGVELHTILKAMEVSLVHALHLLAFGMS